MKSLNVIIILIIFITISANAFSQGISINEDNTDADASAILDISSTDKGVLLPRMTSLQRTSISSPVSGLMVYDIDTDSFWYYDSKWTEILADNIQGITDADSDTKIESELNTDEDKLRFYTAGNERMQIDESGNVLIGDETNYTKIKSNGEILLYGDATVFEDLRVPVTSTKRGGTKDPAFSIVKNNGSASQGVFAYWFDNSTEEELYLIVQMPHSWKEGSQVYPHIHWTIDSDLGSDNVEWGLEYSWASIGNAYGNSSIITAYNPFPAILPVTSYEHAYTSLPAIDASGQTSSSILLCRVFRNATSSNDTYSGDAALLEIDFHYEIDRMGEDFVNY